MRREQWVEAFSACCDLGQSEFQAHSVFPFRSGVQLLLLPCPVVVRTLYCAERHSDAATERARILVPIDGARDLPRLLSLTPAGGRSASRHGHRRLGRCRVKGSKPIGPEGTARDGTGRAHCHCRPDGEVSGEAISRGGAGGAAPLRRGGGPAAGRRRRARHAAASGRGRAGAQGRRRGGASGAAVGSE